MRKMLTILGLVLFSLSLTTGCGIFGGGPARGEASSETIVVAVDSTGSMSLNDLKGFSHEGVQIFPAMLSTGRGLGLYSCEAEGKELVPISYLNQREDRDYFREKIELLQSNQPGSLIGSLSDIMQELPRIRARARKGDKKPTLVLISDGQDYESNYSVVMKKTRQLAAQGWKIDTLGVTPKQNSELLQELSAATGGEYLKVSDPADLLAAYLRISRDRERLFTYEGEGNRIAVAPQTTRLILSMVKANAATRFGRVAMLAGGRSRENIDLEADNVYCYRSTHFHIIHISEPKPGGLGYTVRGTAKQMTAFAHLPIQISLGTKDIGKKREEGKKVPIAVHISARNPELLKKVKVMCEAEIVDKAGNILTPTVRLASPQSEKVEKQPASAKKNPAEKTNKKGNPAPEKKAPEKGKKNDEKKENPLRALDFAGELIPYTKIEQGRPQKVTLRVKVKLPSQVKDIPGEWVKLEEYEFELFPTTAFIAFAPERIEFAPLWQHQEVISKELTVKTALREDVTLRSSEEMPPMFGLAPESLLTMAGAPATAMLTLNPAVAEPEGNVQKEIILEGDVKLREERFTRKLPVTYSVYKLQAPEKIETLAYPGEVVNIPLTALISTVPVIELTPSIGEEDMLKLGEIELTFEHTADGQILKCSIPETIEDGVYTAELVLTPSVEGLAPHRLPLEIAVSATRLSVTPESIVLKQQTAGWLEQNIEIELQYESDCLFAFSKSDLKEESTDAMIFEKFDIVIAPGEGWDGKSIKAGAKQIMTLKLYVSSDTPDGVYTGKIILEATPEKGRAGKVELPVRVEVKR